MIYNFNTQPFIVINGVSSRTIKGLLIQKLPPITKPAIRTKAETVDGRDGDIVTTLGYAAYNKTLEIGLSYEYSIDDIISFFSSSGRVVFSNEPEKYYNFSIYAQVDFEKLIRFKTASVTFHVQPFKYSDIESEKTFKESDFIGGNGVYVRNDGNIYSRPKITITGAGLVRLYINNDRRLELSLPTTGKTIIINSEDMNSYDENGNFLNRLVYGNYDEVRFIPGKNRVSFTGSVTEIKIDNYSRWL